MLRAFVLMTCLCVHALSALTCHSYKDTIQPLIERGDVKGLREAFSTMNKAPRSVNAFRIPPIEVSIWQENSAIKKLLSLSKPLIKSIETPDAWPENNNVRVSESAVSENFDPETSYHGGIRYIYNCATFQEKSCFNKECHYDPSKPVIISRKSEEIYVPLENFVAANGDAMSDHVTMDEGSRSYVIKGFSKMTVRECGARQLFFNATNKVHDCFDTLKFFSLPELVEYRSLPEDDANFEKKRKKFEVPHSSLYIKRNYFAIMS